MLCAHWDTRSQADRDPNPDNRTKPIPGANDGASGVAVLLEIARIAAASPPPRSLLIAFWDGEDMGQSGESEEFCLGSKYWAEHQIPVPIKEAILLDMIGDADLEIPVEQFSELNAPSLRERLWEIAKTLELTAFTVGQGAPVFDDHVRLQRVGIQAVNIVDFQYTYWHTVEDTPDKCSAESLGQVGRLLIGFIYGSE
jgi:Zn-dependent M28 family amino/carboxypeptidase